MKILGVPGVICEFGIQRGTTLAQLLAMRGIYVPYTYSRKICGFDTFEGFTVIDEKDQGFSQLGDYSVNIGHLSYLKKF
jgi:hypothetical protein